jgi:hypothetical protein
MKKLLSNCNVWFLLNGKYIKQYTDFTSGKVLTMDINISSDDSLPAACSYLNKTLIFEEMAMHENESSVTEKTDLLKLADKKFQITLQFLSQRIIQ